MSAVRIGTSVFNPSTLRLERDGEVIRLQRQPAKLLALLVSRAGTVITRDEIRNELWRDTAVAYDQSINYSIRQVRIALGPDAHLLETLPREGYRLTATVAPAAVRAGRGRARRLAVAAGIGLSIFAAGFGAGTVARDTEAGRFVYVHLVHPDRCPYMRFLIVPHRNS